MKKKKRQRKIIIGILSCVLILLLVIAGFIGVKESKKDEPVLGKVTEIFNKDKKENSESEEEQIPQLMTSEEAQTLIKKDSEGEYQEDEAITSGEIVCGQTAAFSGQYVEDGRGEIVENVAAIQVTNKSDKYLELAILVYKINGEEATFVATGLPAGKTAWVMEKSRMAVSSDAEFKYQGSTTSFREDVVNSNENIKITADGNMLSATNTSQKDMENIVAYYKVKHDDGNYFGGITYVVDFGEVKAGETVETLAGHYAEGSSDIVRLDWQEK